MSRHDQCPHPLPIINFKDVYASMSIYIPKAIVYKITHIPTGRYYIGKTIQVQEFINEEYNGSGTVWGQYLQCPSSRENSNEKF